MGFLDGGKRPPALSWKSRDTLGKPLGGTIIKIEGLHEDVYATEYNKPGEIKRWGKPTQDNPEPKPVKQLIIWLQTDERDPKNPLDDGIRCDYIEEESLKFSKDYAIVAKRGQPKNSPYSAFLAALEKAGTPKDFKEGGQYFRAWIGEEPGANDKDRKLWAVKYVPPTSGILGSGSTDAKTLNPFGQEASPNGKATTEQPASKPAASVTNPFDDDVPAQTEQPAKDPATIAREQIKFRLTDATKAAVAAIWQEVHDNPALTWDDELDKMAKTRLEQIANPPQREMATVSNPFE